ncbi:MAG: Phosphonate ABC transporter phosphate-binding periplasmic component [Parcubacteria bacterium C7867-004]|nr:MAG: Phosphonate ABC transporter phosphate-binding periplasmic component [Parcubacteria bacterium C7867-004]
MTHLKHSLRNPFVLISLVILGLTLLGTVVIPYALATTYDRTPSNATSTALFQKKKEAPKFDAAKYDARMISIANYASTTATTTPRLWPAKTVYPNSGAILPDKRIIAYYGNFYSTKMGILGEYEKPVVLQKMKQEIARWETADPGVKVMPAIEYIAVVAQDNPGKSGMYRARMPDDQTDMAVAMAKEIDGIVILDIQVGLSTVQSEIPALDAYLSMPQVHLALDPEFSMKGGEKPGTVIGSLNSSDINYAIQYLSDLVREHNLPPKVLIVHRFTQAMVKNAELIKPTPEVQVVMVMDGWGSPARKIGTYKSFIYPEPVQFTGFKLFYKNDLKPPSERLLTPAELLKLTPQPMFVQYQ